MNSTDEATDLQTFAASIGAVVVEDEPELEEKPKKSTPRARRGRRSKEVWRILPNFPNYEISNYGRVRSLARRKADDVLKPRPNRLDQTLHVTLYDAGGARREPNIYWLMVSVGFIKHHPRRVKKSGCPA